MLVIWIVGLLKVHFWHFIFWIVRLFETSQIDFFLSPSKNGNFCRKIEICPQPFFIKKPKIENFAIFKEFFEEKSLFLEPKLPENNLPVFYTNYLKALQIGKNTTGPGKPLADSFNYEINSERAYLNVSYTIVN